MDNEIIRWTLSHANQLLICTERLVPGGHQLRVCYNNLLIATRLCDGLDDAIRWAEQVRRRWESAGAVALS